MKSRVRTVREVNPEIAAPVIGALVTALGILFALAGTSKLLRPAAFGSSLRALTGLPSQLVPVTAVSVATAEIVGGVGLILGHPAGAIAMLLVIAATTIVASVAVARRQVVPCECLGARLGQRMSSATILRNLCFAGIATLPLMAPATTATTPVFLAGVAVLMFYMGFEWWAGTVARRARRGRLP